MRLRLLSILTVVGVVGVATPVHAVPTPGFYQVTALGPLDDTVFEMLIENSGHFPIEVIVFNLFPTEADAPGHQHLTIDGAPFDVINNTGGAANFVPVADDFWAFEFTSFDPGDSFQFSWDADIPGDSDYAAIVREQVGMQISQVSGQGGNSGNLAIEGDHLVLRMVSTPFVQPEPTTLLLLGSGLIALLRRRHR